MKLFPAPFFAPLFEGCLVSSPRTIHRKSTENCLLALNFCLFLPLTTSKHGNWTEQKWVKGWQTDGVGQTVRQTCRFRDLPPLSRGMPSLWWPSERIRGGCFMWQLANILMVVGCHNEVLWFFIWLGWQVFECVCLNGCECVWGWLLLVGRMTGWVRKLGIMQTHWTNKKNAGGNCICKSFCCFYRDGGITEEKNKLIFFKLVFFVEFGQPVTMRSFRLLVLLVKKEWFVTLAKKSSIRNWCQT